MTVVNVYTGKGAEEARGDESFRVCSTRHFHFGSELLRVLHVYGSLPCSVAVIVCEL